MRSVGTRKMTLLWDAKYTKHQLKIKPRKNSKELSNYRENAMISDKQAVGHHSPLNNEKCEKNILSGSKHVYKISRHVPLARTCR